MNFNKENKVFPNFLKTKPALDDNYDEEIFSTTENRSFPKELLFSQATGLVSKKFSRNIRKKLLSSYNLDGFIEEMESHETFDKHYVSDLAFDNVGELFVSASTSGVIEIFNFYQYLQSSHRFRRSMAYNSTMQELKAVQLQASQIRSKKRKREDDDDERITKRPKSDSMVRIQRLLDLYNRQDGANEDKENNQNLFNLLRGGNQNTNSDVIYDDIIDVDEPTPKETFQAKNLQRQISALQDRLKFKYTEPSITYQTRYKASSVRWSPANQDLMFTGFLNYNKIFVYDIALETPDPVGQFNTPGSGTNDLAFLPNRENGVFAGGRDGVLRMYDQNSQFDRPSMSFTAPNQANAINGIEPAIDGNKIYLVHPDSSVTIWDIRIAQRPVDVLSMTSIMFKAIYPISRPGQLLSIKSVPYDNQLLAVDMGHCSGMLNLVTKQFKSCGLLQKEAETNVGESFLKGRSGFHGDLFYATDPRRDTITYYDFPSNQISKPFASVRASGNITATARHPKFNFILAGLDDNSTDVLGAIHSEIREVTQVRCYSKNKGKEYVDKIVKFDYNKKYFANTPIVLQRFPDARGRVLFAKERIEAGQVILISKPYAMTVIDNYKSQVCSKCHNKLELAEEIIPSKFVKTRQYCCRHCYESSELLDFFEAKPLKRLNMMPKSFLRQADGDSKNTAELILRILTRKFIEERPRLNFKNIPLPPKLTDEVKSNVINDTSDLIQASNKSNFGGKNGSNKQPLFEDGLTYEDVERLVANMGTVPEKREDETEDILKVLHQCMDPRLLISDDDIRELVCRIDCNSFEIDKYEKRVLMEQDTQDNSVPKPTDISTGHGLYLTASYFNHSCTPNCKFYHDMDCNLVIESRRVIDAGEELTISYGIGVNGNEEIDEVRDICKREVQKVFRFSCNCSSKKN